MTDDSKFQAVENKVKIVMVKYGFCQVGHCHFPNIKKLFVRVAELVNDTFVYHMQGVFY